METSVTYIFLYSSEYISQLVRGILCTLAGGLKLPTDELCFVFIGEPIKQTLNDIESYQNAFYEISTDNTIFTQKVIKPIILNEGNYNHCAYQLLFQASNYEFTLREIVSHLENFKFEKLEQNDRIIVFSQVSVPESLYIWKWVKHFAKTDFVQHICEYSCCDNKEQQNFYRFLIDQYGDLDFSLITGCHEEAYKTGMTMLQSIEAILYNSNQVLNGVPIAINKKKYMYFTQENLSSSKFATSLCRIELLYQFNCWYQNKDNRIEKWIKNMNAISGDLWDNGKTFTSLKAMLCIYERWSKEIQPDHFRVLLNDAYKFHFSSCLNQTTTKIKGLREEEIRQIRLQSIIKSLAEISNNYISEKIKTEKWSFIFPKYKIAFRTIMELNYPSPLYLWDLTNYAFDKDYLRDKAAKHLRAACLNLWEVFFEQRKKNVQKVYKVEEIWIKDMIKQEKDVLQTTDIGKLLLYEQIIFTIYPIQGTPPLAITSPLTGFAIIDIENILKEKSEEKDLCERSLELQSFIYNYTRCIGGFSEVFLDYIKQQIHNEKQYKEESRGSNLFQLYSQLRNHIPLYITQKRK